MYMAFIKFLNITPLVNFLFFINYSCHFATPYSRFYFVMRGERHEFNSLKLHSHLVNDAIQFYASLAVSDLLVVQETYVNILFSILLIDS